VHDLEVYAGERERGDPSCILVVIVHMQ